jgi:hypothetical protein
MGIPLLDLTGTRFERMHLNVVSGSITRARVNRRAVRDQAKWEYWAMMDPLVIASVTCPRIGHCGDVESCLRIRDLDGLGSYNLVERASETDRAMCQN